MNVSQSLIYRRNLVSATRVSCSRLCCCAHGVFTWRENTELHCSPYLSTFIFISLIMSASLIRRGLELFSDKDGVKRKQKRSGAHQSALMQRISSDKQGVQRRIRQLQRPGGAARSTTTVKDKRIRSALDVYRKKRKRSNYGINLNYFRCKANKTHSSHAAKIVEKNSSRRACHQPDQPVKKSSDKSVFTEAEFQKFQKEYFSNL